MAKIIESSNNTRRLIKLSSEDIISIVKDYQTIVPRFSSYRETIDYLSDVVIFIPEEP